MDDFDAYTKHKYEPYKPPLQSALSQASEVEPPKLKPLSDEQITSCWKKAIQSGDLCIEQLVREVEKLHGITGESNDLVA